MGLAEIGAQEKEAHNRCAGLESHSLLISQDAAHFQVLWEEVPDPQT